VARHELLGEILRGLELRRGAHRAEDPEASFLESVDDAGGERRLGAPTVR
jgi:hypothetical protein